MTNLSASWYRGAGAEAVWAPTNLGEVSYGVLRLSETSLSSLLCPQVGFRVGLGEHTGRSDEVPGGQREARLAVLLLGGDVLKQAITSVRCQFTYEDSITGAQR